MDIDTVTAYLKIIFLSFLLTNLDCGFAHAQLKVELNFGEEDNYIATKKTVASSVAVTDYSRQLTTHGNYQIVQPAKPSPAGGSCLELNGIDQFLMLPSNADVQMSGNLAFSVSMWIQADPQLVLGDIVYSDNGFISGYRLFIEDRKLSLELREEKKEIFVSDSLIPDREWVHIGFICDGANDSVAFYMNGQRLESLPFRTVSQVHAGGFTCIGGSIRSSQPNFLKARIDGFRFFAGQDTIFDYIRQSILAGEQSSRKKKTPSASLYFELNQNYPNPFNASTTISYILKKSGMVTLKIYDLLGNRVTTVCEGEQNPGLYDFSWDGTDSHKNPVPSGIYMIRLEFDTFVQTRKMVLVK